jgi:hypothetical protein
MRLRLRAPDEANPLCPACGLFSLRRKSEGNAKPRFCDAMICATVTR